MTTLAYSVAVPTMNRPQELRRCLEHVLRQEPPPEHVLIIDDGNLNPREIEGWLGDAAGKLNYRHKSRTGTVESMNLAADLCPSEWLLLLDDDVYLEPDFMRRIEEALASFPIDSSVAAVAGYPLRAGRQPHHLRAILRAILERLFLLRGRTEGRFLPSSFLTNYEDGTHPDHPYRVEHVPGGLGLWRAAVLRKYRFDSWYTGYAAGQDQELSYRVSRDYALIAQPAARAAHDKSPRSRTNRRSLGEMRLRNQLFFFRRHFARKPLSWILFAWAVLGLLLLQFGSLATSPERRPRFDEFRGMIDALLRSPRRKEEQP